MGRYCAPEAIGYPEATLAVCAKLAAMAVEDRVHLEVTHLATWRAWLAAHPETADGVWVVTYKGGSGTQSPPYGALVEEGSASTGSTPDRARRWCPTTAAKAARNERANPWVPKDKR